MKHITSPTSLGFYSAFIPLAAIVLALAVGCSHRHDHGDEHASHDHGHDDHGHDDHGHDHDAGVSVTKYTNRTELFMEHGELLRNIPEQLIIHLTRLSDFSPITEGSLEVKLIAASGESYSTSLDHPNRDGIFLPVIEPPFSGAVRMELHLNSPQVDDIQIVENVVVYASASDLPDKGTEEDESADHIAYLKEQQWKNPFATVPAELRSISQSVPAAAILELPKSHQAIVPAPISGIVRRAPQSELLEAGTAKRQGQPLFIIEPDADWQSGLAQLQESYLLAQAEFQRVAQLETQGAVSEKRVSESRIRLETLKRAIEKIGGPAATEHASDFQASATAPISGLISEIFVIAGQKVESGDPLAMMIDPSKLILETQIVPSRLESAGPIRDAIFRPSGSINTYRVSELEGHSISSTALANSTDGVAIFRFIFNNPEDSLIPGSKATAHLLAESSADASAAIPVSAVHEEAGQSIVYVQIGGETIEKRTPRLGLTDGRLVQVLSGIEPGERVVIQGANLIRLSSLSTSEMGHGHAH